MTHVLGHHHLSMITKQAQRNNHFYTHVLGLRRVKLTVNQDEPSMYHLFYADRVGTPGTSLTFFEIPAVGKTYRGTNAITDRKSTRLNSSHVRISYAVFCLKKKTKNQHKITQLTTPASCILRN